MTLPEYRNEPFTDFNNPDNAAAMERALADVKAQFGKTYPLVINGERIVTDVTIPQPTRPNQRRWLGMLPARRLSRQSLR